MRLSLFTDYSLRVLLYASAKKHEMVTTKEVGDYYGISYHHLVKVVHQLSSKGYLQIRKGKGGGFQLALEPGDINIGKVVRDMEPDFNLVACFDCSSGGCAITSFCNLKSELRLALKAFLNSLDQVTLADIGKNNQFFWPKKAS